MQDRSRLYTIMCAAFLAGAIALTLLLWFRTPPEHVPWAAVAWFAVFIAVAELLAVNTSQSRGTLILPSASLHWLGPCIFGPAPAAVCSAAAALMGHLAMGLAHHVSRVLSSRVGEVASDSRSLESSRRLLVRFAALTARLSENWQIVSARARAEGMALYLSTLAIGAGLSGLAYLGLGGRLLIHSHPQTDMLSQFVLPFLGLVAVALIVEHGEYVIGMAIMYPMVGTRGWYGFVLSAKLAFIEGVLPVWRGELFLVVVSILMAYLYSRIGVPGLVVAIMPVLALRDFFHQWVKTKEAYLDTITTLATYMQHYHPYTRGHLKRVAEMSERLARELRLPVESIRHMSVAGFLHDIGKIGVSEEILDKTGKLTDDEWERIKEHPVKGAEIISHLELLEGIVDWIKYHHKWYNGAGYPAGNGGNGSIPLEAAIIAAADAFDAMTDDRELSLEWVCDSCGFKPENGDRPRQCPKCGAEKRRIYREPKSLDEAIEELRRGAGTQFDPRVVKAFLTMVDREGIHINAE